MWGEVLSVLFLLLTTDLELLKNIEARVAPPDILIQLVQI